MPQDPLENIMSYLRDSGSVDHNTKQTRQARMSQERRRSGAAPVPQRDQGKRNLDTSNLDKKPMDEYSKKLRGIGEGRVREHGKEGDIEVDDRDMTPRIVDQLNEAILSHKIAIHREEDPERVRGLEQSAESIRQRVKELGGEPIYADESVEEGLKKLKGHGQIGAPQIQDEIQRIQQDAKTDVLDSIQSPETFLQQQQQTQPDQPTQPSDELGTTQQTREMGGELPTTDVQEGVEEPTQPVDPLQDTFSQLGITSQDQAPIREVAEGVGAYVDWDPDTRQVTVSGPGGERTLTPDSIEDGRAYAPGDTLSQILQDIGSVEAPEPVEEPVEDPVTEEPTDQYVPPKPQVDADFFNEIVQQYGLEPRSQEEIEEHAEAIVQRQAEGKRRPIERELERFEREWPEEFQQAKEQIQEATKDMQADIQEDMSARGMFYSSIMANSLESLDEAAVQEIGEISRDAANHVAELRSDLRDIEQWAVLEQEVVRRELEAEEQQRKDMLASMHMEVAQWADQMALDQWYKESQIALQERGQRLEELKFERQEMIERGQFEAIAQMAHNPDIQQEMKNMGISMSEFKQLPVEQRAAQVNSLLDFMEWDQRKTRSEIETAIMIGEYELNQRLTEHQIEAELERISIDRARVANESRRLGIEEQQIELAQQEMDNVTIEDYGNLLALQEDLEIANEQVGSVMAETEDPTQIEWGPLETRLEGMLAVSRDQLPPELSRTITPQIESTLSKIREARQGGVDATTGANILNEAKETIEATDGLIQGLGIDRERAKELGETRRDGTGDSTRGDIMDMLR